jgi:hypothetical protein
MDIIEHGHEEYVQAMPGLRGAAEREVLALRTEVERLREGTEEAIRLLELVPARPRPGQLLEVRVCLRGALNASITGGT